MRNPAS